MKRTTLPNSKLVCAVKPASRSGTQHMQLWCRKMTSLALTAAALLTAASIPAAQLTWDAGNTNNGATIDSASGNWDTGTTNLNWNTGAANTPWTQTSTTVALNGGTFAGPDAAAGTYQVFLDGGQIAVNSLVIKNSGYLFYGGALYEPAGINYYVSNGVSVTFSNLLTGPNSATTWYLGLDGAAASMNCLAGFSGMQLAIGSTNGSVVYLGGSSSGGVFTDNGNIIQTNGTMNISTTWQMARPGFGTVNMPSAGAAAFPSTYTLNGPNAAIIQAGAPVITRGGGSGTFNLINGTVTLTGTARPAIASADNTANTHANFYMSGGTMTIGSSASAGAVAMLTAGSGAGSTAVFSQSGGTNYIWGGIQIGSTTAGTPGAGSVAAVTNSGGFLYLGNVGSIGITIAVNPAAANYITLSGGTVGALQTWQSAAPLTLATLNGNITFKCADNTDNPFNITLSGAVTGAGGLYKTGGGTLTLKGANNYAGSTVVSNGILSIVPLLNPTNGSLILDGSAASPTLSVAPVSAGQFMTVNGDLTYASGTVTADFNYGSLPPSTSAALIQVTNNVAFTVTPQVTIEGTAIPVGTYPLIKYGGSVSGTVPTTPTSLPASTTGYITNIVATKTIALVVDSSPVTASLAWKIGSGGWGFITNKNWTLFGGAVNYTEPNAVQFDDTASGPFPVTISNLVSVSPSGITVLGTNAWTIQNNGGSIDGSASLTKVGSGTVTLTGTNTYSGGTTVSGGQLNINNGGNSTANSAIGTGPLTLALNTKVDNTSGQSVTLQPTIAENWLDDWTFVGSTNLNTGAGAVTLGSAIVVLTVSNNILETDGAIGDSGNAYKLEKAGNGTLILGTDSTFSGGLQVDSGVVKVKSANGFGNGDLTLNGSCSIENDSGTDLAISGITSVSINGGIFTYLGTNSMDFGAVTLNPQFVTFNILTNTVTFGGNVTMGNFTGVKIGQGTLALAGSIANINQPFNGIVNQGELDLGHTAGNAIGTGNSLFGLLVQSNSVAKVTGPAGQFPSGQAVPLKLNGGGVFDLNGNSQTIYTIGMTNGVLRNSAAASFSTLNIASGQVINMVGTNNVNVFDVPDAAAELDINGNVAGGASLVKTGPGLVNLMGATNTYTGNTTISNGTLTINTEFLSANSTVTIATNATLGNNGILNLNFSDSGTNNVTALVLGGVSKPAGVYNATTDPAYLTGSGSLQVQAVAPPTSTNADLISLVLTPAGTLSPTFGSNVLTYAATEAYTNTPTVTVVNADLTATNRLIFNGSTNLLASAVASSPLSLTLGVTNVVKVQVTAQDGITVKTYTVNVTLQPSLTTPTLSNSVSGSTLTLSWPADHLGYSLQSQTNALSLGLTTNWVTLPGSGSVTTTNLPINNGNPTVFYRLVYP